MSKQELSYSSYQFGTRAIHAGQKPDPISGAVMTPISLSSTFAQKQIGVRYPGDYEYSRSGNPTRDVFENLLASLEGAKHGLAFSSGLGATTIISNLLKSGDHIICMDDTYGGTGRYFRIAAKNAGIKVDFVDVTDLSLLEQAITKETKMVWIETPTNPTLKICDIKKIAEKLENRGIIYVVDNTFMSPFYQSPLALGADIVIHSVTKYLNGHSDVVMGCCATNSDKLYAELQYLQNAMGVVPSPFDCFLAIRGIKTLHLRMKEHTKNATAIAQFLETSDKVSKVTYPGLKSHPQYEIAQKQMRGAGGMITFYVKGGLKQASQFLENVKLFCLAESLGGVESLVESPALMTHASVPEDLRKKLGIDDTLIRLSCGVEDVEDLLADVKNALSFVTLD